MHEIKDKHVLIGRINRTVLSMSICSVNLYVDLIPEDFQLVDMFFTGLVSVLWRKPDVSVHDVVFGDSVRQWLPFPSPRFATGTM